MKSIEETLRKEIRCSGQSVNSIAKQANINQPVLCNFVNGAGINIRTADKLARFFGFVIVKADAPMSSR